ncbi:integrase catalytic domain-containing protein [Trichonephila clavipes]|nr:integrase catalytic domain-containing protein [Trichonephila clavipes]
MKLNQIASEERSGLSSAQMENPVLSALADRLEEINSRVGRLQEASAVTARKSGGNYFNRRESVFKCFYCGIQGHRQVECRKRQRDERAARYQPPWRNAASEYFSNHPGSEGRNVHFGEYAFRDNYAAPRHSSSTKLQNKNIHLTNSQIKIDPQTNDTILEIRNDSDNIITLNKNMKIITVNNYEDFSSDFPVSQDILPPLTEKDFNLSGRKFKVFTDYKPLAGFLSNKNPSSKILRWKLALEEFNYDIHYIRGSLNSVADHRYISNITIALPDSKDLINMQREDSVLSTIIQKIDQNDVSLQISNYFINGEGLLCHLSKRPSRSHRFNTTRKQVCIPHCLKAKILESVHSEYGGHLKFFKTYHRLSENFFWHNMYKDTKNFVRSCTICLSRKNAFKIPPAPHQLVEQSTEPGETCHMDIFGPLKTTLKVMGIQKRHISSYSTHVNGRVEKPNQSLANILASISQNRNDWDEQLPHTMLALNSAIHEATYTSPFFLEHGRDIRLSYTYEKNSDTPQNKYEYVEKLLPSLEHTFNKVLNNLKDQEASHVELSTRATKQHHYDYKIGSLCFIKTPNIKSNLSPKLRPKFEGPYRVIERFSKVNYRVQHVEQLRKGFNMHVNRMIPFIKRFSYLHLKNLGDLQPDETEVKGIVPGPWYNLRARAGNSAR